MGRRPHVDDEDEQGGEVRWSDGVRFAIVPEWVLLHETLTPVAVKLYGLLALHANSQGNCSYRRKLLAAQLGRSTNTLDKTLDELRDAGAVTTEQRTKLDGSLGASIYWVHARPNNEGGYPRTRGDVPSSAGHQELNGSELDVDVDVEAPPLPLPGDLSRSQQIDVVFTYWRTARSKSERWKLNRERRAKINTRLNTFTVEELCRAIDGIAYDPWAERVKADDLLYVFRNDSSVEKFLHFFESRPPPERRRVTGAELRARAREAANG